jgi:DNA (cytosine-5)-methyltransferase 1
MNHIGLFEGIGGFSLAARWMGWETIAWCEWNEFGQKVLKHHFPKAQPHGDITKTDFTIYRGQCDIVTGGFPCQPYSLAGKRKGKADDRHLWPEMCRAIREIQPTWVVGENVFGLVNWDGGLVFNEVQADLEAEGYEVFPYVLPAVSVNAPHRRDRIWFVAYSKHNGQWNSVNGTNENKVFEKQGTERVDCSAECIKPITANGLRRSTSDTDSNGQHGSNSEYEINTSEGREYALNDFEQVAVYASSKGLEGSARQVKRRKDIRPAGSSQSGTWNNFPTQSPICSGDDGISTRLDSITFPKWRNESIKAAGNAIVPQVAFQIFKTIKLYNEKL